MIPRYTLPPMDAMWSEAAKYGRWLRVELAVLDAQEALGQVPEGTAQAVRAKAAVDLERIAAIEAEVKHDVLAFVRSLEEQVGEPGRWLHLGLTASDVVDTANALALCEAFDAILAELDALIAGIHRRAVEHKATAMVGRTHGMHAEPITFGLKLLNWQAQFERDRVRLRQAREAIAVGQCSGSVGTYANVDPDVERRACQALGLRPAKISNQVLQRDGYAQALGALAILGATVERVAVEVRHLSRTEISEIYERGAHRSSSMPHKKNPITAETLSGLARLLRANLHAQLESIALWHERDISNSSVERVVLPDSFTLAHYMVVKARGLVDKLEVDAERMSTNLELTHGLVYSQAALLALVDRGMPRARAHEHIRDLSMKVDGKRPLKALLLEDETVKGYLTAQDVEALFDPARAVRHLEAMFERFGPP